METIDFLFVISSAALGVGLAMDAFSVSLANGLREPDMSQGKMNAVAGVYAFFQYIMPVVGWICVHTIVELFSAFEKCIPWIALILLVYLGGKMILEGLGKRQKPDGESINQNRLTGGELILQGVATSIDALSVGFAIAQYRFAMANIAAIIIAAVTFAICRGGLAIGKKAGTHLSWKAGILGGTILILIGIEVFARGLL